MCVRACAHVCECLCVGACIGLCVCVSVCVCVHVHLVLFDRQEQNETTELFVKLIGSGCS